MIKKIVALLLGTVIIANASFAQAKPAVAPKPAATKAVEKVKVAAAPTKMEAAKAVEKVKATAPPAPPLKKDGTPDKRFKDAKAAAPTGPTKKDGTPDMRFKENKKKG